MVRREEGGGKEGGKSTPKVCCMRHMTKDKEAEEKVNTVHLSIHLSILDEVQS